MVDKTNEGDVHDSPEYQALLKDLKAYDNPEVFSAPSLPQLYKFRIVNLLLPEAAVIRVEVDGQALIDSLRESMFGIMRNAPDSEKTMREYYGDMNWEDLRAHILTDKDYLESEQVMFWFFVRHFPKLMVNIYNITTLMSVISAIGRSLDNPAEKELKEKAVRDTLKLMLRLLGNDIKQMLRTRSKGRPRTKNPASGAPEIARQVWQIGRDMMGEARGIEAVPGLKEIANVLDLSADALGRRLTRSGWPWARIKNDLANLT